MEQYFEHIISRLTHEDMKLLGILYDNDIDASYKAIKKSDLFSRSELSEAKFRKSIQRLHAICLVENVTGDKEHSWYITCFGISAINKSFEGGDL